MTFHYDISGTDFVRAGSASADVKKKLKALGVPLPVIRRTVIAMYEAEMNMVVYAGGGEADVSVSDTEIAITMTDHGPGIPDVEKAMQEGFSTAPDAVREMGFGAGMGLSNMKRNTDRFEIMSTSGAGTVIRMVIFRT